MLAYPPVPISTKSCDVARNIEILVVTEPLFALGIPALNIVPFEIDSTRGLSSVISAQFAFNSVGDL